MGGFATIILIERISFHSPIRGIEAQGSEQTLMAIAGPMSRKMLEHYSYIRVAAKRKALEGIVRPDSIEAAAQDWA